MQLELIEHATNKVHIALISKAIYRDIPLKKDGWKFNWRKLFKTEGSDFYKISLLNSPNQVEGILMLSLLFDQMVYMNTIEIAPYNYGSDGTYEHVAACLIAYACYMSFEKGRGNYSGFLSFDSKTQLINFYIKKYGATHIGGTKMFIGSENGKKLIQQYLNIKL